MQTGQAFPGEFFEPGYKVLARHGDIYDPFNYAGSRDASSLGDAIVIELLDRYPEQVARALDPLVQDQQITAEERQRIVDRLKELDNLRPVTEAPAWVLGVLGDTQSREAKQIIEETWKRCVEEFVKVPYVAGQSWFRRFPLKLALKLSSHVWKPILERVLGWLNLFAFGVGEDRYRRSAIKEERFRSKQASYVLYGHTHNYLLAPLPRLQPVTDPGQDNVYFNTGTWRMTWNKARNTRDFIGWHVLTYVAIFRREENREYTFEVWHGALGQTVGVAGAAPSAHAPDAS